MASHGQPTQPGQAQAPQATEARGETPAAEPQGETLPGKALAGETSADAARGEARSRGGRGEMPTRGARRPGRPGGGTGVPGEGEVLRRGMEAFAELGYERASARELARRLGVSHNFINDRYGSKANFWRAVVDSLLAEDQRERRELLEGEVDDVERVRAVISHFYQVAVEAPLVGRLLADEFGQESERLDYLYERYVEPTLELLAPAVERLMASGRMRTVPMDVLFFAVISPVAALVQLPLAHRLGRPQPVTRESQTQTARELADLIADGLLGPKP